jgi:hypothetical protein
MVRKNMIQKFIMVEFVSNNLNTQEDTNKMINLIEKKLQMSNTEAKSFLRESIGLCK